LFFFISISFNTWKLFQVKRNEIKISIKSKPEFRKTDRELLKLLSNYFQVTSDKIKIIYGTKSEKNSLHFRLSKFKKNYFNYNCEYNILNNKCNRNIQ
jgi:uncharacterized protein YggU (UPF0235/DUF167 family)